MEDNNFIQEKIQGLNKSIHQKKYTIYQQETMKALLKATSDESKVLKKEYRRLITENNTLQQKVFKFEIKLRETEDIRRENEELGAQVKEMRRKVIIQRTNYNSFRSASAIRMVVLYKHAVLRNSLRKLTKELKQYPDLRKELEQGKNNTDQHRLKNLFLCDKIQQQELMLEDRRVTKEDLKYLQEEEDALKKQIKYLRTKQRKATKQMFKQEEMEERIQTARDFVAHLTRRRQALLQQVEEQSGLIKTKRVLEATVQSQRLEVQAELEAAQNQSLQNLPVLRPSTSST